MRKKEWVLISASSEIPHYWYTFSNIFQINLNDHTSFINIILINLGGPDNPVFKMTNIKKKKKTWKKKSFPEFREQIFKLHCFL